MSHYKKYDNYDLEPKTTVQGKAYLGWKEIWRKLCQPGKLLVLDCYQGVLEDDVIASLASYSNQYTVYHTTQAFHPPEKIRTMVEADVTDDTIFGYLTRLQIEDYICPERCESLCQKLSKNPDKTALIGPGAALLAQKAGLDKNKVVVYLNMARWEIQQRQRQGLLSNLGVKNQGASAKLQYKHSYFVDWRVLDRYKTSSWHDWDWVIDCNQREALCLEQQAKMLHAKDYFSALQKIANQPFRLVPFFDPGVWGGQWMKEVCGLKNYRRNTAATVAPPNYAWCFDCVPEENSLQLEVEGTLLEFPAVDLVFAQARDLLGEPVHARFGKEFPIRFDFLDTMDGQNLSFQVHPLTEYIQEKFGMHYTQDESYYILDAEDDAVVYLGLKDGIEAREMLQDLKQAQQDPNKPFLAEKHVNTIAAHKHDHFLIPAGTCHCSGSGSMVLEISATPYIFTFKLWDWERLDLDGQPRPINLEHGAQNIDWSRTSSWVKEQLVNNVKPLSGDQLCGAEQAEQTGLHSREFIETRRYWFDGPTQHHTGDMENGSVHVINLVEGKAAKIQGENFPAFELHYAETVIIPAAVGAYTIEPIERLLPKQKLGMIKAYVR